MNKKVAEYLYNQKRNILIKEGLYDVVYNDSDEKNDDFTEYDSRNGKYCKIVPCECSEEEMSVIMQYASKGKKSVLGTVLYYVFIVLAIAVYFIGFIQGLQFERATELMFGTWGMFLVGGTVLLWMAEVINLLNRGRDI